MIKTENSPTLSLEDTIAANKLQNEEYKIWKKVVPSLYQHITTFKPIFKKLSPQQVESLPKCITFTNKIVDDNNHNGIIQTCVFYSLGSEVYEFNCNLPLGAYSQDNKDDTKLPTPHYNEQEITYTAEEIRYEPKWIWRDETIAKLVDLTKNKFLAMSTRGSIAIFEDGYSSPIKCITETVDNSKGNIVVDLDVSKSHNTIIKSKSDTETNQSIIEIIDNSTTWGNKMISISLSNIIIEKIRFMEPDFFCTIGKDNSLGIWQNKSSDEHEPNWCLKFDSTNEILQTVATSPFIDELFALGFQDGGIKLYDIRNLKAQETIKDLPLFKLVQTDADPVEEIIFSRVSPLELITVGKSGHIYHWNLEYIFAKANEEGFEENNNNSRRSEIMGQNEIQRECLTFFHTGGARRSHNDLIPHPVSYHNLIDDLVSTVDQDGLITVYKPCTGKYLPEETEDTEQPDVEMTDANIATEPTATTTTTKPTTTAPVSSTQ